MDGFDLAVVDTNPPNASNFFNVYMVANFHIDIATVLTNMNVLAS